MKKILFFLLPFVILTAVLTGCDTNRKPYEEAIRDEKYSEALFNNLISLGDFLDAPALAEEVRKAVEYAELHAHSDEISINDFSDSDEFINQPLNDVDNPVFTPAPQLDSQALVGSWELSTDDSAIYSFNADGSGYRGGDFILFYDWYTDDRGYLGRRFTWSADGSVINLRYTDTTANTHEEWSCTLDGNILTLTSTELVDDPKQLRMIRSS
jgi:hypothetical protein